MRALATRLAVVKSLKMLMVLLWAPLLTPLTLSTTFLQRLCSYAEHYESAGAGIISLYAINLSKVATTLPRTAVQ
jgi:hypothetical protein